MHLAIFTCLGYYRILDIGLYWWHIGRLARMSVYGYRGRRFDPGNSMLFPWAGRFIRIASVDSAVKWVPGWDNLVKDVQCYELFGGIALKNHAFSSSFFPLTYQDKYKYIWRVNDSATVGAMLALFLLEQRFHLMWLRVLSYYREMLLSAIVHLEI